MNGISFNLTTIAIAWAASSVVILPLLIVAVRFAVVPLLETLSRHRAVPGDGLEARLTRIEEGLARLGRDLDRLASNASRRAS